MRIKLAPGQHVDTDTMSLQELSDLKRLIDDQIDGIIAQIDAAKARHIATGEYADANWYASAQTALRLKRRSAQRLQELLRPARKQLRQAELSVEQYFMDVCRERMEKDLYAALLYEAVKRRNEARAAAHLDQEESNHG